MVVHRRIQGAAMNGTAAWRACNPPPSPCFVVFKTADESSRGLDQPFPPPSISRSFVPRHSFPSRGRMADPGRRNYGGLHGGSRTFYLGLRGTRLLGLCKCLSIFLFLMGAGNITTTRKMRMTMDGSKVAEFEGVTCYKSGYIEYMWSEYCFIFISSVESENTIEKHLLSKEKCRGRCTGVKRSLKNNLPSSRMKEEEEIETTTRSLTRELTLSRYESIYKYILSFDPPLQPLRRLFVPRNLSKLRIDIDINPTSSIPYVEGVYNRWSRQTLFKPSFRRVSFKQRWYSAGA